MMITVQKPAALLGAVVIGAGLLAPVAPDPLPVPVRTVQLDVALTNVSILDQLAGVAEFIVKTVARILLLPALPVIIGAVLYQNTAQCYSNSSCGRDPLFQLSGLILRTTTALTAAAEPAPVPTAVKRPASARSSSSGQPHRSPNAAATPRAKVSDKATNSKRGQGHSARG
jgi:hypothetical protein